MYIVHGHRNQNDTFQTNYFFMIEWHWFLGSWDRVIWYEIPIQFLFHQPHLVSTTFLFYYFYYYHLIWLQKIRQKIAEFYRYVKIGNTYLKPIILCQISQKSFCLEYHSFNHEKLLIWNVLIWVWLLHFWECLAAIQKVVS